jgi:diguanylate cyclase (GGDEF)-like protein/PAS domain S-box-containing protein
MEKKREKLRGSVWERALERARLGMWDWNLRTGECFYSDTWFHMLGYEPGVLPYTGDLWLKLVHPDDRDHAIVSGDRHIIGETDGIETELRLRHKEGHWVWVLDRGGIVERDQDGRPVRMVGVQTDISRQKSAETELAEVNERFRLALAASQTGIWHYDIGSQTSYWDGRTRQIFGLDPEAGKLPRETWHRFLHPDDREEAERKHGDPALFDHGRMEMRYRIVRADGSIRHVETLAEFSEQPRPHGSIVGTIRDVTEEVLAAEELVTERERLRTTLEAISDAVISTDTDDVITFVNPAAAAMLGRSEARLIGLRRSEVFAAIDGLSLIASGSGSPSGEIVTLPGAEHNRIVRAKATAIHSTAGRVCGQVYTLQDVTAEQQKQQELAYAARHDPLTGLLNRAAFDGVLEERVSEAVECPFALLYIDLDHFKALNDFAGHAAGDQALKVIADQIRQCLPESAVIARLGGDEFAVIFASHEAAEAEARAQSILSGIQAAVLGQHGGYRQVGASIGIVMVHESGLGAADVLAHADDTCYAAKSSGRNRFMLFSSDTRRLSSSLTAARIVGDIADAMEDGRVKLFGQEIRLLCDPAMSSGRVEVLARMVSRNGRLMAPGEFIPAAERFGRASTLDRWIIRAALLRYGPILGPGKLTLGFNLSAQTISDPLLWDFVEATVFETDAQFERIVFEITETAAVTNFDAAQRFVSQARARGCRISLDDFGAGLSSFDYLRHFPVDSLKINGSFIENLASSDFDRQIVASINRIAEGLGYDVVAEKIENAETLSILSSMKVKFGQGFLFHRPEPLEEIVQRMEKGELKASFGDMPNTA